MLWPKRSVARPRATDRKRAGEGGEPDAFGAALYARSPPLCAAVHRQKSALTRAAPEAHLRSFVSAYPFAGGRVMRSSPPDTIGDDAAPTRPSGPLSGQMGDMIRWINGASRTALFACLVQQKLSVGPNKPSMSPRPTDRGRGAASSRGRRQRPVHRPRSRTAAHDPFGALWCPFLPSIRRAIKAPTWKAVHPNA